MTRRILGPTYGCSPPAAAWCAFVTLVATMALSPRAAQPQEGSGKGPRSTVPEEYAKDLQALIVSESDLPQGIRLKTFERRGSKTVPVKDNPQIHTDTQAIWFLSAFAGAGFDPPMAKAAMTASYYETEENRELWICAWRFEELADAKELAESILDFSAALNDERSRKETRIVLRRGPIVVEITRDKDASDKAFTSFRMILEKALKKVYPEEERAGDADHELNAQDAKQQQVHRDELAKFMVVPKSTDNFKLIERNERLSPQAGLHKNPYIGSDERVLRSLLRRMSSGAVRFDRKEVKVNLDAVYREDHGGLLEIYGLRLGTKSFATSIRQGKENAFASIGVDKTDGGALVWFERDAVLVLLARDRNVADATFNTLRKRLEAVATEK